MSQMMPGNMRYHIQKNHFHHISNSTEIVEKYDLLCMHESPLVS